MAFEENLAEFLDTNDFAVSAIILPKVGAEITVNGIFDREYELLSGGEVDISSFKPVFHCKSSDIEGIEYGDFLEYSGKSYTIIELQPDGTGMTILKLKEDDE